MDEAASHACCRLEADRELLLAVSQHCPQLQTLRFGSFMGGRRGGSALPTLLALLPALRGPEAEADDWERCSFAEEVSLLRVHCCVTQLPS